MTGRFLDTLDGHWEGTRVVLDRRFRYLDSAGLVWEVPAGFDTDLSSIPWRKLSIAEAGVIHDYLYRQAGLPIASPVGDSTVEHLFVDREHADWIYRDALAADAMDLRRWLYWLGLRLFGGPTWRRYLRANRGAP